MRTFSGIRVFRAILLAALVAVASSRPAAGASVSFSFFYESLAPHGRWVATASYGQVWAPAVSRGWAPYVYGQWLYTSYGWTWVAADPWGELPYRYGTWVWIDPYGWAWVPGYVWAPAWVTWAYTDDYVGWAPVPPSFTLTAAGYFGRPVVVQETRYVFVPARRFVGTPVSSVRVSASRNGAILSHADRVTAFDVSSGVLRNVGPSPARIEKSSGRRIERQPLRKAKIEPVRFERSGFATASRVSVASPQRSRPAVRDEAVKASKGKEKHAPASKPKTVARKTNSKKPPAIESSPRGNASQPQKAQRVRSEKPQDGSKSAVRRPERSSKVNVEKASRPDRERRAASRAPQASRPKADKSKQTQREEPERRPDRESKARGGL